MSFEKRRIHKTSTSSTPKKRSYRTSVSKSGSKKWKGIFWKVLWWFILFLFIAGCIGMFVLYKKYIEPLPSIDELEKLEIAEASIIYDRKWNELYKVFEEKRTYQDYENINENMIQAIVAWEDKRFFENPWVDLIGLTRAVLYRVSGKSEKLEGTSTLTQQLIRNMIITNERTAERKIKEMYLAYKLTNNLSKEKILELYLNKISFGSNAFGIEQAARTFFAKGSKDLSILESSMIASLPKGPSYYSPYNNFDRLVGYPYLYNPEDPDNQVQLTTKTQVVENTELVWKLKAFIDNLKIQRLSETRAVLCGLKREHVKTNISIDGDGCSMMNYSELLTLLNGIKISSSESEDSEIIEYQTGRKDFILWRMLEDGYIDFDEYKQAVTRGIGFEFKAYTEDIKYPHFVFYVREFLEQKYGKEILERGGLRIYTSLDPVLQDKAEEIVKTWADNNNARFAAQNAALVSIDNKTGQILTMVWGRDYFDEENKWNVNITTSRLQPGSSFKPFVYSIAIDQEIIGSKTPIYDLKTTFPGWYEPNNFDGKFKGKMDVSTALNNSRNIPAVKMYFLAGWEKPIWEWMKNLWVNSIDDFKAEYMENQGKEYYFWASMWLWTAMMTPLEIAWAYSVYANLGYKKEVTPIVKILDSRGLVIEEYIAEEDKGKLVIDPATAYILNDILSDTTTRPESWNKFLAMEGRPVASKTGTSTKQFEKNWEKIIYPRNLWTVWYTPQITTVVWSGNNDGEPTNFQWNGLEASGPIWKQFMDFYHSDEAVENWIQPEWVKQVNISKMSWLLAPDSLWWGLVTSSLFVNPPTEYWAGVRSVQVDLLCNGAVTENTPEAAIGYVSVWSIHSLRPDDPAWENPVRTWAYNSGYASGIRTSVSSKPCERTDLASDIQIGAKIWGKTFIAGSNYVDIWYQSVSPIQSLSIFLWWNKIQTVDIGWKTQWVYGGNITIPKGTEGQMGLRISAIDDQYYSASVSYTIDVVGKDTDAPVISVSNPVDGTVALYAGDSFNLRWSVSDRSPIKSLNISLNGTPLTTGLSWRSFAKLITTDGLPEWSHTLVVEAYDSNFNKWLAAVKLTILPGNRPGTPPPEPSEVAPEDVPTEETEEATPEETLETDEAESEPEE